MSCESRQPSFSRQWPDCACPHGRHDRLRPTTNPPRSSRLPTSPTVAERGFRHCRSRSRARRGWQDFRCSCCARHCIAYRTRGALRPPMEVSTGEDGRQAAAVEDSCSVLFRSSQRRTPPIVRRPGAAEAAETEPRRGAGDLCATSRAPPTTSTRLAVDIGSVSF